MHLPVDAHGPIPVRSQVTDQLKHVIEGGGVPRDQARPSIPGDGRWPRQPSESAARAIEDLKRSGYRPLHSCLEVP
jgi:hypothetical protein